MIEHHRDEEQGERGKNEAPNIKRTLKKKTPERDSFSWPWLEKSIREKIEEVSKADISFVIKNIHLPWM